MLINKPTYAKSIILSSVHFLMSFLRNSPFSTLSSLDEKSAMKSHVKIKIKELECEQENCDVTSLARTENLGTQNSWNTTPHCCNSWSKFSKWRYALKDKPYSNNIIPSSTK